MQTPLGDTVARINSSGIGPGDKLAILADTGSEMAWLIVACWQAGIVVVPLSNRLTETQRDQALIDLGCSALVSDRDLGRDIIPLAEVVKNAPPAFNGVSLENLSLNLEQHASIILTSGSMGHAKGVLHTLKSHYYSALGSHENIPFDAGDTWLVSLPFYHMGGLALIMRALLHGGSLAFPEQGESLTVAIRRTGATHLSLVPTQLRSMLNEGTQIQGLGLKAVLVGGAACTPYLVKQAVTLGLPLYLTYGSTEMASQVATTARGDARERPTCSGRVLCHLEIKLAGDGEILVRGATRFVGYVEEGSLVSPFDSEGWFATGDLGRLDAAGNLYVHSRKDAMFISGGENIYPEEIERALNERLQAEACTVVPVPDERYGQRPVAFIKTQAVLPDRDDLELDLERFKWPDRLYIWPDDVDFSNKPNRKTMTERALRLQQEA